MAHLRHHLSRKFLVGEDLGARRLELPQRVAPLLLRLLRTLLRHLGAPAQRLALALERHDRLGVGAHARVQLDERRPTTAARRGRRHQAGRARRLHGGGLLLQLHARRRLVRLGHGALRDGRLALLLQAAALLLARAQLPLQLAHLLVGARGQLGPLPRRVLLQLHPLPLRLAARLLGRVTRLLRRLALRLQRGAVLERRSLELPLGRLLRTCRRLEAGTRRRRLR